MKTNQVVDHLKVPGTRDSLYFKQIGLNLSKHHIIFFHDLGEYHDRYNEFSRFCLKKKLGMTFVDMKGHGLSSGTRGHVESLTELMQDYNYFWKAQKEQYKDKEVIVIGHGIGALIAMLFMLENRDIQGLVMVNPTIKFSSTLATRIENYFAAYPFLNKIRINTHMTGESISDEKQVSNSYDHDPLVNKKITISTYRAIQDLLEQVKNSTYYVTRPVMYVIGMEDRVVDLEMSELFSSSVDYNVMTLKKYKDLGHELFNELDRDKVFKDIYNWINNNFKNS